LESEQFNEEVACQNKSEEIIVQGLVQDGYKRDCFIDLKRKRRFSNLP
jgi:hypothetical protein